MKRAFSHLFISSVLLILLAASVSAVIIDEGDLNPFGSPCALSVNDLTPERILSWSAVSGASYYKVGYRTCDGKIIGLAEVSGTSYTHSNYPSECTEYLVVAYDAGDVRICSAHMDVGNCPCP